MFVGIAPANAPEFIMAVVVDEPTAKGYFGGAIAAPIFKEILEDVLRVRNIPNNESEVFPAAKVSPGAFQVNLTNIRDLGAVILKHGSG